MLKKLLPLFLLIFLCTEGHAAFKVENLSSPKKIGSVSLEETLNKRRSERSFASQEISKDQISELLWAAQGITETTWGFRTAPSAGSCYPIEIYLAKKDGVFHYLPQSNTLEQLKKEDCRPSLVRASLGQNFIGEAPAVFVFAISFDRSVEKFGRRAERYVDMEVGHAAQNLLLEATALGLVACPVGSFWDGALGRSLGLPPDQESRYLIPVGYLR